MKRKIGFGLFALALLVLPFWVGSQFYVSLASQILIASIMAMSLNLLVGYGGLVSLGQAAYPGLSAYIVGWLVTAGGVGQLPAVLIAIAATVVIAAFFGVLALRAKGLSFLMITLALGQILWGIAYRWVSITGGDNGISDIARPKPFGISLSDPTAFYYFCLIAFVVALLGIVLFVRSPFGATLRGARDQPTRMTALGYNVWLIRWITFVMAGFWGAYAGVLYVYYNQFISPHALVLANSAEMLLMVIAGGAGTLAGPIVGATLVLILKNWVSAYVSRWMMLLGIVFVLIVTLMPEGLVPGMPKLRRMAWRRMRPLLPALREADEPRPAALTRKRGHWL